MACRRSSCCSRQCRKCPWSWMAGWRRMARRVGESMWGCIMKRIVLVAICDPFYQLINMRVWHVVWSEHNKNDCMLLMFVLRRNRMVMVFCNEPVVLDAITACVLADKASSTAWACEAFSTQFRVTSSFFKQGGKILLMEVMGRRGSGCLLFR